MPTPEQKFELKKRITNRLVGHFLPKLSALLAELRHGEARMLALDLLPAFVHPDEVGRRVPLRLTRQLRLLVLPLTLGAAAAASAATTATATTVATFL